MFTHRTDESARRPSADFLAKFKEQHFSPEHLKRESNELAHQEIDSASHSMYPLFCDNPDGTRYDLDPTPKAATGVPFPFTPSFLDTNSTTFAAFAAQPSGYYTPTPRASTLGPQLYGLPATTETFNPSDSLSHPTPNAFNAPSIFDSRLPIDNAHYMHPRPHPYAQDSYPGISIPGSAVGAVGSESPHSNYSPETGSGAETTDPELYMASGIHAKFMNPGVTPSPDIYGQYVPNAMACSAPCEFRFATNLHAATAMLRHSSDIPVTYLNKRQAYTISVVDSSPAVQNKEVKRYRTIVRIAFDEEEQRRTAPACWRLWKDGRGTLESGGNPDKLRAIDYEPVETRAVNDKKSNSETSFQVEESSTSFDRFTITWSSTSPTPSVYFCVRFLFLSTDFSHSKGVKGVPVRLVAKTEFLGTGESVFPNSAASELSYCKIKLFRDKGAERKLANDRQHLERAIEKLRQQAQQLTIDASDPSQPMANRKKKRHSVSGASMTESYMSSPQRRHRRDWSISSNTSSLSAGANPRSQQDEVQRKLDKAVIMESMFASIRSVSVFSLIGDPADDPSLPFSPIAPQSQWEAPGIGVSFAAETTMANTQRGSPALSQTSFSSHTSEKVPYAGTSPLVHPVSPTAAATGMTTMMSPSPLSHKVHVQAATRDLEAIGVDPFYVPAPAPTIRPALCVYVAPAKIGANGDPHTMHLPTTVDPSNDIYYAVYVPARSASSLTVAIASKLGLDPSNIVRTTIVNKRGLRLVLDDEVVREMLDKQDMRVNVREIEFQSDPHQEHNMTIENRSSLELFLAY